MIGTIMSAAGGLASIAANLIPDKQITETSKAYTPDPISMKNAGLFNAQVNLGEQSIDSTRVEVPFGKTALSAIGGLLGAGGGLIGDGGLEGMGASVTNKEKMGAWRESRANKKLIKNADFGAGQTIV